MRTFMVGAASAAILTFLSFGAATAGAFAPMNVANSTDKYVSLMLYGAQGQKQRWTIENSSCLAPGQSVQFTNRYPNLKLRAQVKSGDCNSATISDTNLVQNVLTADPHVVLQAHVNAENGGYHVRFQ